MKDFVLGSEAVALNVKLSEIFDDSICKDMWNNALKTMRDDDPNRYINMIHREQTLINGQIMILNSHINKIPAEMTNRYPHQVSDMVKGTRRDGTIGSIRVTGYPVPEYYRKKAIRERLKKMLELKEAELLELTCQAEEYIESIEKPELRIMFRLYFIDGLSDAKVAERMNMAFPKRRIKYTDENIKKRRQRFFEKI